MKFIPLIKTKEIKKVKEISDMFTHFSENNKSISSVYLLDKKGLDKNHPDLSLHQYAQRWFTTIVDAGCQHIGDVVDVLLAGADIVVLRPYIWREPDLSSIRDISESKMYLWFDPNNKYILKPYASLLYNQADGIVLNLDQQNSPLSFPVCDIIKKLVTSYSVDNILIFDPNNKHDREIKSYNFPNRIVNQEQVD